jgi:GNAT superfamily N-acetyltransferase
MRIRKAVAEDAEQLTSLLKDIGWFEALTSDSVEASMQRVRSQLERCLADGSHSMFVAEADQGEIKGYVSVHWLPYLFMRGPEGYVSELFVRGSARGARIGRQLLELVEHEARQRGCQRLSLINLRIRESYQRQFYTKAGWRERSEAANFIRVLD